MFGPSLFGSFDDPFFNDTQEAHHRHMVPMEMGSMYPQQSMPSIEARGVRRPPQPFRPNPANNPMADEFMYLADTGEEMVFPPILAKGNELEITVTYKDILTIRDEKGVSASCNDHSGNAVEARIVGGNSPGKGFLELRTLLDKWRRVCKDGFDERVTNLLCGELTELLIIPVGSSELGYPAVRKVSYGTGDWMLAGEDCIKAPICNVNGKNESSTSDTLNHDDGKNESSTSDTLNHDDGQNTSSPSDTLNHEDGQNTSSASDTLNHEGHHMRQQPVDGLLSKSGYLKPKKIFLLALALIHIVPPCVANEDINIDCRKDVSFTSPNYPSSYPNRANEKWSITAPKGRRILVSFTDFNIQADDFLNLADKVDDQNFKRYTGEEMKFPPFLTKGNELEMTFISLESGRRRGFNVSASCYDHSGDASVPRIVDGNSPGKGFLEVHTQSGDWRRVCKDDFDQRMAEVVCGELGYPAVKKVSYGTDDCISDRQDCIKAPICNEYTFRLEDCSWSSGNCTSADAVKVECYEPGYKGCYDPKDLPQLNGFIFESTSQCVSSCRANSGEALAIMNGIQCSCSTTDEVNLPDIALVTCIQNRQETQRLISSLVYDVSVGFCDELDDVIHGSWGSNITWFGFTVHLTCDDGYSLNGGGTVQCVPGRSPYYPVWNGSAPTCDMSGATVGFCNQMDDVMNGSWDSNITSFGSIVNLTCDDGYRLNGSGTLQCGTEVSSQIHVWNGSIPTCEMIEGTRADLLPLYIFLGTSPLLAVCGVIICCNRKRLRQMYNKSREAAGTGDGSTNAPLPDSSQIKNPFMPSNV